MASFSGTIREFRQYMGPFARNLVQYNTRKHKNTIGKCQRCGATERLQSAHVGRDRNQVIDSALQKLGKVVESGVNFTVDLASFKNEFTKEHHPLAETVEILCPDCHKEHDYERTSTDGESRSARSGRERDGCLPIFLVPSDPVIFKRELLKSRVAEIEMAYCDGSAEVKPWRLNAFTDASNVIGNLRSRPDFRKDKWQARGLKQITVRVMPVTAEGKAQE
jgi:DNA-directed RNA polymerase subunit M/transcription elongation factor TFIIS